VATIINVILKGSALLNRLLSQQASNRKALTEQERQKRERAAVEQRRRQAIAKAAPPSFTRRVEEPAATPTGAPTVLLISCTFIDLPEWFYPGGVARAPDATAQLNAAQTPATGKLLTVTAPPFTLEDWQDFDGRAPQAGGVYQRLYRPYTAIHDGGVAFSFGRSYAVLPKALSLSGTDVATMAAPQFESLRTDPTAQEFPFMVYPYVIGPRGFAVGYDGPNIVLQVYTEASARDSDDKPGCAILYSVGDQFRIVPFLIYSTSPSAQTANTFMRSYWTTPDTLYTVAAVDRTVTGEVRYTISGATWPAVSISGLRFYMIRSYATWDQVPPTEVRWAYDAAGIPAVDLPPNPLNDKTFRLSASIDYQNPYKKDAYIATTYEHPLYSMATPRIQKGPTGIAAVWPTQQALIDGQANAYSFYRQKFSAASRSTTSSEAGAASFDQIQTGNDAWDSSIPADYVPTYQLRRFEPRIVYDQSTDVITFNFAKDGDDNADSPYYPVRIPRAQLRPLLDSTRGNWFFGYNPPYSTFKNRTPPGRYAQLEVSIISA
jgi:hypothetical protein